MATSDPGAGQAAIRGAAIAFPVVFLVVSVLLLVGGAKPIEAVGDASFVGFWAGPAFGGLFGAVLYLDRLDEQSARTQASGHSSRSPR